MNYPTICQAIPCRHYQVLRLLILGVIGALPSIAGSEVLDVTSRVSDSAVAKLSHAYEFD